MNRVLEHLERLTNAFGAPGLEDDVNSIVKEYIDSSYEVSEDKFRNLYVRSNKKKNITIQLDAHLDEVGFMVHSIQENGLIRFIPLGSWVESSLPGQELHIKNKDGEIVKGIVATIPPHFMSESDRNKPLAIDSMRLDIGLNSKDEVQKKGIFPGCFIVPATEFSEDHGVLYGKAFDCRIGCSAMIEVFNGLKDEELAVELMGAFSTQEEVGGRGIEMITTVMKPDLAIVFEGTPADDSFLGKDEMQTILGAGPMLRFVDVRMITHPRFQRFALDVAKKHSIPVQAAVRKGGGTNAHYIHKENGGVPTIVLGIPVRYAHTPRGFSHIDDLMNGIELAKAIIRELNEDVYAGF